MRKPAETQYAIHEFLRERWSPRAFSRQPLEVEKMLSLFEAARWSPSLGNSQPWSFIVTSHADPEGHDKLVSTMTGRNPLWARNVPLLVLTVTKMNSERPGLDRYAYYDLGQSVAHLTVQAAAMGLRVHQMGGFDKEKARQLFDIPEGYEPMTVIAIGYAGSVDDLPQELRDSETAPRSRKPLTDFVFDDRWDQPLRVEVSAARTV